MLQPEKKKKLPANRYRRILLFVLILAIITAGLTAVIMRKMTRPAQLLFIEAYADGSTQPDIIIVDMNGSTTPLRIEMPPDYGAVWLPDGSAIEYSPDNEPHALYRVNVDGSNLRKLGPLAVGAVVKQFLPDGSGSVFVPRDAEQRDIFMANLEGMNPSNFTNTPDINEWLPEWSPDGTRLLFSCDSARLCIMNADGTGRTMFDVGDAVILPHWMPDGQQIAYICRRFIYLCAINSDGTGQRTITQLSPDNYHFIKDHAWSPDGTRLAFVLEASSVNDEIYVVGLDGTAPVNLTQRVGRESQPAWSPDSSQIAFVSDYYGSGVRTQIEVMNADGTNVRRLTFYESQKQSPRWRPNPCGAWDIVCYLTRP